MKIISGTFGIRGSAYISAHLLVIEGAKQATFRREEIEFISAQVMKERRFGWFGFILGGAILAAILGSFFGLIGILTGIGIAIAGSFYTIKANMVDLKFKNGDAVVLECSKREVRDLIELKG